MSIVQDLKWILAENIRGYAETRPRRLFICVGVVGEETTSIKYRITKYEEGMTYSQYKVHCSGTNPFFPDAIFECQQDVFMYLYARNELFVPRHGFTACKVVDGDGEVYDLPDPGGDNWNRRINFDTWSLRMTPFDWISKFGFEQAYLRYLQEEGLENNPDNQWNFVSTGEYKSLFQDVWFAKYLHHAFGEEVEDM